MPPKKAAAAKPAAERSTRAKAPAKSTATASKVSKPAKEAAAKKETAKKAASVSAAKSAASAKSTAKKTESAAEPKKRGRPAKGDESADESADEPAAANTTRKRKSPDDEVDAPKVHKKAKKDEAPAAEKKTTTKAAPKKPVAKKAALKAEPKTTKKAAAKKAAPEEESEDETPEAAEPKAKPAPKKAAAPKKVAAPKPPKPAKVLPEINPAPTTIIDVYVFGEGSAGELGLGAKSSDGKKVVDVTRPRLNERLSAKSVGVVLIAVGGMHCAALTHDNKILTWGVNDQGALGRETGEGPMKDVKETSDDSSDSDDDESDLNPTEAEPREVDSAHFPEGTKFAALFAGDSSTFALTTTGLVYGWGTFRANDGILGFRTDVKIQKTPLFIPELKKIVGMAMGTNHVLALDIKGKVFTWGAGEQHQLARRVVQRTATGGLVPREFGLSRKNIVYVGGGDYHSFAIDKKGDVYSWGLNTFGQTGVPKDEGVDENTVATPTLVESLKGYEFEQLAGGAHHTLARTKKGEVLTWGRMDNNQSGVKVENIPKEAVFFDDHDKPRYLKKPVQVPGINAAYVATGNDTCVAIDTEGKAWSWGFSSNYQTGQGTDEDVLEAAVIDNTAIRGKKLVWAGVGGQFGLIGGEAEVHLD